MREIKFRAWDSLNNQMRQAGQDGKSIGDWTFQTYFNPSTHCFKALIYGKEFLVTDDPYPMYDHEERFLPIMQYTGLTDKNGVEIYEGDIVRFNYNIGTVVSECGSFGIAFQKCIDYETMIKEIHEYTGCNNQLSMCCNDNFISLWEIYWNYNDDEDRMCAMEIIGNVHQNADLLTKEE